MSLDALFSTIADFISEHFALFCFVIVALFGFWRVTYRNRRAKAASKILGKAIANQAAEPITLHPEIDPLLCSGCAGCTRVCPEGDVLQLIDHKAVLIAPTKCVGHGECEQACPTGAISLVFGTKTRGMDIPRITSDYETNVEGLYIAGELGGMGLIRNAVRQGNTAADHAITAISQENSREAVDTDLLIVGAGPAGLSAALTAISKKRSYICIEQNSFGGTVYNYPRQKIVMTYPAELPLIGKMKFKRNRISKEDLLGFWQDARSRTGLEVREKVRFETVKKEGEIFHVQTSDGLIRAKKVILCMGVRGTPRRLGLENEDSAKVAYNLIDPEQYQDSDIAVVGAGNAAAEAVQMLAATGLKNRVTQVVKTASIDRCNEANLKALKEIESKGQLHIRYNSSVKAIASDSLKIAGPAGEETLSNHYLFIFAGADLPSQFLMGLGIEIEKKFGAALQKSPLKKE
jgi:thioredoxin reductase/NAD-dependent dihydropyrimidine dehydrogenase PreA subunit